MRRCYLCDVPLRRENVSPVTDDACRSCVPRIDQDDRIGRVMGRPEPMQEKDDQ